MRETPRGDAAGARNKDRGRDAHMRRPKGGDRRRREETRKPEVHTATPPRRIGVDADSPFAALGALREVLVKRGKETNS